MGASLFVGRVGGLAVALGVGAAVFSSAGVAFADSGTQAESGASSQTSNPARAAAQKATAGPAAARKSRSSRTAAAAAAPAAEASAAEAVVDVPAADATPVVDVPAADATPVVDVPAADATPVVDATPTDAVAYSAAPPPVPAGSSGTTKQAALKASSGLTAAPSQIFYDGVIQGNLNVTSASGCGTLGSTCKLSYEFVKSSDGGKVKIGNVPVSQANLPDNAKGGPESYTFLPYATWIDPANPDRHATPTVQNSGTQSFTVRVREQTKFDQTLAGIPLFGSINQAVINQFQDWGLFSGLIGASILSTVNVDPNLLARGRQVAYTYKVSSFDGTLISMNFFPAAQDSLVLPNQDQATIFNGPGLGSPGQTNPYGLYQTAGTVPGIGLMRGQGFPAPFNEVPLGFNVITWDPRGEFESGGVLQLDNPFYEGRDVSALIDWAEVNTPLLFEERTAWPDSDPLPPSDPVPSIAMMGASYGGAVQMTTVDPRIKVIVPTITWNSLNQALYPDNVFKTGWANALAQALLTVDPFISGTDTVATSIDRVNPQITQALITGNLFGYISETAQAVLSSSGPTSLLTKLSVPTFYNQGIVDALFPLQQAYENGATQALQNPFFSGDNPISASGDGADLISTIWFCGGHGVCTTQTLDQQTKQNSAMFLENLLWVNAYAKEYLKDYPLDPPITVNVPGIGEITFDNTGQALPILVSVIDRWAWWDQNGVALVAANSFAPWDPTFYNTPPVVATQATGGRINSFTSQSGPLTAQDPGADVACQLAAQACEFPVNQIFATKAKNAVNVNIPVPENPGNIDGVGGNVPCDNNRCLAIIGSPTVSFTYSGRGNAKALYAQIVDNATGQVLGNINTAIPVVLDGKEHTIDSFPLANIVYSPPKAVGASLTLQIVASASLYKNNDVIWSADISDITVSLPTAGRPEGTGDFHIIPNPIAALIP